MARITTAPPIDTTTTPAPTEAPTMTAAPETPDAPKGKPAGPAGPKGKPAGPAGVPGHPAERPTVRPTKPTPTKPAVPSTKVDEDRRKSTKIDDGRPTIGGKLGKPGKDVKTSTPAIGPRIAAGPGDGPSGGRKGTKAPSARPARRIGPGPGTVTGRAYHGLDAAYAFFNRVLFSGKLPEVVLTLQRKKGSLGYYAPARFADTANRTEAAGASVADMRAAGAVDEIALNPSSFRERSTIDVLSTLVHEMVHVAQAHFGKPSRGGYHNAEWAAAMAAVGLIPTDTGKPGGKMTGQHMDHYIEPGGRFAVAAAAFFTAGGTVTLFGDLWSDGDDAAKPKSKAGVKAKYTCPVCGLNAWAKPDARLSCTDCEEEMESDEAA